ncbi:MAG: hypothetical protein Q9211_004984, partial [Gyalolechia sp. 1 TL-2023]
MKLNHPHNLLPFILLSRFTTTVLSQGTVTLALATTNDETSTTLTVPFNTLFDASSQKGVSIQVTNGDDLSIADDDILCQCFSDTAGTQPLGESFDNVFPGAEFATEPTKIGSIFCSDSAGLKAQLAGPGNGNANNNQAQPSPAETTTTAASSAAITTQPPSPATTFSTRPSTTAATAPVATSTAALNNNENAQVPSSSSSPPIDDDTPTASLKFALSSDPSDDSSTQFPVPIDSSIVQTMGLAKKAKSVTVATFSGANAGNVGKLVCQAFSDTEAKDPVEGGFGVDVER